mmetsp:Transcript_8747/g.16989  ORF Transcript_8747/g.16989 Transcript_8747/m.16989 type:complete len:333 (+) Transcript_8747:22-1020(+)
MEPVESKMMDTQGALSLKEDDMKLMLAAKTHIGSRNCNKKMTEYVWTRRVEGNHVVNIGKTWEKLMLAARIIVAIENPSDVIAVSGSQNGARAVFKYAQHTGASYIGMRYTPGTFSNQIEKRFMEPRLLIVSDPNLDGQPIKESALANIPVIAFCDTDAELRFVDVAIPCNNKGKHSVALMWWFLAREVNRLRGSISRNETWNVIVDLFMYREPEEKEEEEKTKKLTEDAAKDEKKVAEAVETPAGTLGGLKLAEEEQWPGVTVDPVVAPPAVSTGAVGADPSSWADGPGDAAPVSGGGWDAIPQTAVAPVAAPADDAKGELPAWADAAPPQ